MTLRPYHKAPPPSLRNIPKVEIVEAFRACRGIVADAATVLGVPKEDLRTLSRTDPDCIDVVLEMIEQRADVAERNIDEALNSDDPRFRFDASKFYLKNAHIARSRGYVPPAAKVEVSVSNTGFIVQKFSWADGVPFAAHLRSVDDMPPEEAERVKDSPAFRPGPRENYDELREDGSRRPLTSDTMVIGVNSRIVPRLGPPSEPAPEPAPEFETV